MGLRRTDHDFHYGFITTFLPRYNDIVNDSTQRSDIVERIEHRLRRKIGGRQEKVLRFLASHGKASARELASEVGVSTNDITRLLDNFSERSVVCKLRTGEYALLGEHQALMVTYVEGWPDVGPVPDMVVATIEHYVGQRGLRLRNLVIQADVLPKLVTA